MFLKKFLLIFWRWQRRKKMFEKQIKIPEPEEIKEMVPMPESLKKVKAARDALITDVITGKSRIWWRYLHKRKSRQESQPGCTPPQFKQ